MNKLWTQLSDFHRINTFSSLWHFYIITHMVYCAILKKYTGASQWWGTIQYMSYEMYSESRRDVIIDVPISKHLTNRHDRFEYTTVFILVCGGDVILLLLSLSLLQMATRTVMTNYGPLVYRYRYLMIKMYCSIILTSFAVWPTTEGFSSMFQSNQNCAG